VKGVVRMMDYQVTNIQRAYKDVFTLTSLALKLKKKEKKQKKKNEHVQCWRAPSISLPSLHIAQRPTRPVPRETQIGGLTR